VSMCDGTDDPNQTGTKPNRTNWDNPSRTGTTQPSGTTQPNWDSPAKWDSPGRAGTTQPAGPSQSELGHSKDRLSQSGPGRPSPLGRPTQTWSGPIFSPLLSGRTRHDPRTPRPPRPGTADTLCDRSVRPCVFHNRASAYLLVRSPLSLASRPVTVPCLSYGRLATGSQCTCHSSFHAP
jgi:hypothetical protein